jgi:CrcB protein
MAAFAMIGVGAALGAWLRWGLGVALNPVFPTVPLGTVAANLCGGLLMGVAMEVLAIHPEAPPEFRLFALTGFLGGFTTFSTFSAEVVALLARREYSWGMAVVAVHVAGSLLLTAVGIAAAQYLFGRATQ